MTGKNEDFWHEMLEDGAGTDGRRVASQLQDQASQRAVQAVRGLYRIDEDDQQSVQRVWGRLTQRARVVAGEPNSSEFLEAPEPGTLFKRPGRAQKTTLQRRWTLLAACIMAFLLLGSIVSLLVVAPGRGSWQGARTGTTTPTRQGTRITTQLGTHLGNITLGASLADVVALLNPAQPDDQGAVPKGAVPNSKLFYLKYTSIGVQILYDSDSHVTQIAVWLPFNGATAENFAPGMSFSQFAHIYPQATFMQSAELAGYQKTVLPFSKEIVSGALVDDGHGTILLVFFDANQVALQLILQSKK